MLAIIESQINSSIEVKKALLNEKELIQQIDNVILLIIDAYNKGNKILVAGNGGSAADAQHFAGELVARFYFDRPGIPAIALSTDSSVMTAIGNDYGFDRLFSRQIEALGVKGDIFIGISTSGDSPNILKALTVSKDKGLTTIGLTGHSGGQMGRLCDICLKVPSQVTPRIQESHILIGHIICYLVEQQLFGHLNTK